MTEYSFCAQYFFKGSLNPLSAAFRQGAKFSMETSTILIIYSQTGLRGSSLTSFKGFVL